MRAMHRSYLAAAQVLLVGAAFVLQVACGADTTIEGPGLLASTDSSSGGDSSMQQQDGGGGGQDGLGVTDAAAPLDTAIGVDGNNPPPFDGGKPDALKPDVVNPDAVIVDPNLSCVGKCGQVQANMWPCQCDAECAGFGDCCADYGSVCGTVGPGPGPNPTPAEIIACLEGSCGKSVAQCTSNPTCNKFWGCAKNCDSEKCLQGCTSGLDIQALAPILQPLMTCGEQAGCTGGGTTDPPPPGPICGDGTCEQPENSLNCKQDCPNQPAGEVQQCLAAKCSSSYKACFSDPSCVAAVACMNEGKQPQQCVNDQKTGQLLNAMLTCGSKNGCLGGTTDSCGNGACDNGETAQTCPSDCQVVVPPTDSVTKCLSSLCGKAYNSCAKSSSCLASLSCVISGGSLTSCVKDPTTVQALASVVQCGNQQKCFSGGGNAASCEGKCGQFVPGAACQCNAECKTFGNCCGDWAKLCSATPGPVCGDGVCSAPSETSITCPSDCGAPPAKTCKSKADCASTEICCGKADGSQVCTLAGQCK